MGARRRGRRPTARRRSRAEQVQQRRFVLSVGLIALTVIITAAASRPATAATAQPSSATFSPISTTTTLDPRARLVSATYTAELTDPSGGGDSDRSAALLTLDYDANTQELAYELRITSPMPNPSIAALCQGIPGQGGSTVYTLFAGPTVAGRFSGVLCEGAMKSGSLVGPLRGGTLADLVLSIQSGSVYVTIGTTSHPVDALRGQIK